MAALKFLEKVNIFVKNISSVISEEILIDAAQSEETSKIVLVNFFQSYKKLCATIKQYQIQSEYGTLTTRALSIAVGKLIFKDEIDGMFFPLAIPLNDVWVKLNEANKATVVDMLNKLFVYASKVLPEIDIAQTVRARNNLLEQVKSLSEKKSVNINRDELDFNNMRAVAKENSLGPTFDRIVNTCLNDMEAVTKECTGPLTLDVLATNFQKRITNGEISATDLFKVISEIVSTPEAKDEPVD